MADQDQPITPPSPGPDDMHWGINYLREDIQDIRQDMRDFRMEMQSRFGEVQSQFGEIQSQFRDVQAQIGDIQKRMDSRFLWSLGFMATMAAMQMAFVAALIKL